MVFCNYVRNLIGHYLQCNGFTFMLFHGSDDSFPSSGSCKIILNTYCLFETHLFHSKFDSKV